MFFGLCHIAVRSGLPDCRIILRITGARGAGDRAVVGGTASSEQLGGGLRSGKPDRTALRQAGLGSRHRQRGLSVPLSQVSHGCPTHLWDTQLCLFAALAVLFGLCPTFLEHLCHRCGAMVSMPPRFTPCPCCSAFDFQISRCVARIAHCLIKVKGSLNSPGRNDVVHSLPCAALRRHPKRFVARCPYK